jgi:phosphoserine phosphatase RsbU/P
MSDDTAHKSVLQESFDDFLEHSLCGHITTDAEGVIIKANTKFAEWMRVTVPEIEGQRFSDRLSMGGKIYWETHLWPLLRRESSIAE